MDVIIKGKQQGKTTEIIKKAKNHNGYIVCATKQECTRVFDLAREMKVNINFPISFNEFLKGDYYPEGVKKFHIDNAGLLIQEISKVKVETITIDEV